MSKKIELIMAVGMLVIFLIGLIAGMALKPELGVSREEFRQVTGYLRTEVRGLDRIHEREALSADFHKNPPHSDPMDTDAWFVDAVFAAKGDAPMFAVWWDKEGCQCWRANTVPIVGMSDGIELMPTLLSESAASDEG